MDQPKIYSIASDEGERKFYQRKLGLFQLSAVAKCLEGVTVGDLSATALFDALKDKAIDLLSLVLIPEGQSLAEFAKRHEQGDTLKEKAFLALYCDVETILEVLEDFLACNRVSCIVTRSTNIMSVLSKTLEQVGNLNGSVPSSAEEIPAVGTKSLH